MHEPEYGSKTVLTERVSMMLEYLLKRVQNTPQPKSQELRESVRRACEFLAIRNNNPGRYLGHYPFDGTELAYTDNTILDAFKVCTTLGIREPLRNLATAFKNEIPDFVIQSLRDLISGVGFEEIKPMYVCNLTFLRAMLRRLRLATYNRPILIIVTITLFARTRAYLLDSKHYLCSSARIRR
jgi:hypothetical protein